MASSAIHVLRVYNDFTLRSYNNFDYSRLRLATRNRRKIDIGNYEFHVIVCVPADGRGDDAPHLRRAAADWNLLLLHNRRRIGQRLHQCGSDEFSQKNISNLCDESIGNLTFAWLFIISQ